MKGVNLPRSIATVPPAARNGTHRATRKNGAAPKRSTGTEPPGAPFANLEAAPIDVPMWPIHSAVWFQPELAPSVPAWSGLAIERRHRIPAPDFLHSGAVPVQRPDTLDNSRDALAPDARPEIPQSGLAPLGWDPRAVGRKEG
jgi:hypothetical protein